MDRGWDTATTINKLLRIAIVNCHDRRSTENTAEFNGVRPPAYQELESL